MTIRLIIVDDHRIVREGIGYMVSGVEGLELVGEASSGPELFDLLAEVETDVILLDVNMPGMSGLQVLERLQRDGTTARVVMLSMHDDAAYVQHAIRHGAMGYLLKNTGLDELVRALELVMSGKPYLQGELAGALVPGAEPERGTRLSPREIEILKLLADGYGNKQIAKRLGISDATVKTHLKSLYRKLDARSRAEAVGTALRLGLVE
jgi:two-component system nitrate/nitrite response regulator NarL